MFRFQKLFQEGEEMSFIGWIAKSHQGLFLRFAEFGFRLGGGDLEKEKIAEVAGKVLSNTNGIPMSGAELVEFP
jgi:hypothetical protein